MALLVVLLLSSAALVMTLNASLLGLQELSSSQLSNDGGKLGSILDGCLEEVLLRLRLEPDNLSQITLPLATGSCIIDLSASGPSTRVVSILAEFGNLSRQREIFVDLSGGVVKITDLVL